MRIVLLDSFSNRHPSVPCHVFSCLNEKMSKALILNTWVGGRTGTAQNQLPDLCPWNHSLFWRRKKNHSNTKECLWVASSPCFEQQAAGVLHNKLLQHAILFSNEMQATTSNVQVLLVPLWTWMDQRRLKKIWFGTTCTHPARWFSNLLVWSLSSVRHLVFLIHQFQRWWWWPPRLCPDHGVTCRESKGTNMSQLLSGASRICNKKDGC